MKALKDPRAVFAAREAMRRPLVENNILLQRNADHSALVGTVRFVELGEQILELAGAKWPVRHRRCGETRAAITVADNRFFDRAGTGVDHCGSRDREGGPE
jgi:hypothetical protein